jgi:hypothetical protein
MFRALTFGAWLVLGAVAKVVELVVGSQVPGSVVAARRIEAAPDAAGPRPLPVKVVRTDGPVVSDELRGAPITLACECGETWPVYMLLGGRRTIIAEPFLRCGECGEVGEPVV